MGPLHVPARSRTTSISLEHFCELIFTYLISVEDPPYPSRALCSFGCGSINIIIIVPIELPPVGLYKMYTLYPNQTTQRSHRLNSPPCCLEDVVSSHYISWATFNKMLAETSLPYKAAPALSQVREQSRIIEESGSS